eukprot:CAMPEP_0115154330 /NCGR_PEP_ID=MMETSP0227-20121206/67225_1 /TAXON_ID=89957 /ORGANISM="Polarella glacialis, Strain CCMP 1383" /LENGTH=48 /DNA_ID= /DNA_START= /DNA_END= /DNA_ORIENTATION=
MLWADEATAFARGFRQTVPTLSLVAGVRTTDARGVHATVLVLETSFSG